jgi:GTPase SAR1 family protein
MGQIMSPGNRVAYEVLIAKPRFDSGVQFPPRPVPFVDREHEIAKVLRYLDPIAAPRGIFVFGQGGVGKTTIAIEAAHRSWQRGDYDELLFLTAKMSYWNLGEKSDSVTPRRGKYQFASFNGMLGRLGIILGSPGFRSTGIKDEKAKLEELRAALDGRRMLLMIDNLDAIPEPEQTEKFADLVNFYLPQGNKAIITSRGRLLGITGKGLVEIELGPFDEPAAYSLLMALSPERGVNVPLRDIPRLLAASQGHPLVIEQIVALIAEHDVEKTIRELEALERNRLLPFLFESSISRLSTNSRHALIAIDRKSVV